MKKQLLTLIAAMMAIMAIAQEQVPAFPGAEGHGRYVTGGRGGLSGLRWRWRCSDTPRLMKNEELRMKSLLPQ